MSDFPCHDIESAPADAKRLLKESKEDMGFIPNMYRHMAEAPVVLEGYLTLSEIFGRSSLSPQQQQLVLLAASLENGCDFCTAAHSTMAVEEGIDSEVIEALKNGLDCGVDNVDSLVKFTRMIVKQRGHVDEPGIHIDEPGIHAFLAQGFSRQQVLEVVLGVTLKTLSNYTNHITQTAINQELDTEN